MCRASIARYLLSRPPLLFDLQLDRAVVHPFATDGTHIPLQHQHFESLLPDGECEHRSIDAVADHQDVRLAALRPGAGIAALATAATERLAWLGGIGG